MHGHLRSPELPVYGTKTLAVREGILDLHGRAAKRAQGIGPGDTRQETRDNPPDNSLKENLPSFSCLYMSPLCSSLSLPSPYPGQVSPSYYQNSQPKSLLGTPFWIFSTPFCFFLCMCSHNTFCLFQHLPEYIVIITAFICLYTKALSLEAEDCNF